MNLNPDNIDPDTTTYGWVTTAVPDAWVNGNQLDVTLRFWNVRVDAVELVPEPTALSLFALGMLVLRRR